MGSISLVWLTSLCLLIGCCAFMWCYAWISGCWDWREKAEKGSWYSIQAYSSKVWIFWTNCRSDKTDKQIHLLSYSLSWASPSFSRHDVLLKERAPCLFFIRVRATVDCCSSAWVIQKWHLLICSPCLGFEYWALSFRQPSVARTEPNLLSSAIAYVAQRICTEAVSAWFLPGDEPKSTTSMCWQHLGMKLTSVTWHWRKQMHQVHLEISMNVVDCVETLKPKSIDS